MAVRSALNGAGLHASLLLALPDEPPTSATAADAYPHLIDQAASLGVRYLLDLGCAAPAQYNAYRQLLMSVAPHAEAAGIVILIKHHGGIFDTTANMLAFQRQVASPSLQLAFDPGNVLYYSNGQDDSVSSFVEARDIFAAVFVKDCRQVNNQPDVAINAGDGNANWPELIHQLGDRAFDMPLYLEGVGGTNAQERNENVVLSHLRLKEWLQLSTQARAYEAGGCSGNGASSAAISSSAR